ncbi:LysR family transcriptional regulator [Bradyrhizobium diazoefficiens]|uniref:LysR family transcriptional regulator n=1 Tax=Bradyrhizobium diazoefficiens TaxID=1355477 RepID=UPI0004B5E861|nr:LysR family transcriptional regulator [Bradyrhizobium diazoefficiens]
MINLSLARLFVKVARTGSIAAAARQLDMAPSIASRQIAMLERMFKTKLLTRTTRRLSLTEAGLAFLEWAGPVTVSFEELADDIGVLQHKPSGLVRIACNDHAAVTCLPGILGKFCDKYPEVRLQLLTSAEPVRMLEGDCDLALHAGRMPDVNLIGRRVFQYRRKLCASPAYIARRGMPSSVQELQDHDCLTHSQGERLNWSFSYQGKLISQAINSYIEVDNYLSLKRLALAGLGIARLAEGMTKEAIERGDLVEILPGYSPVYADGGLPALWIGFPDKRVLHRTRLIADFLIAELSSRDEP